MRVKIKVCERKTVSVLLSDAHSGPRLYHLSLALMPVSGLHPHPANSVHSFGVEVAAAAVAVFVCVKISSALHGNNRWAHML